MDFVSFYSKDFLKVNHKSDVQESDFFSHEWYFKPLWSLNDEIPFLYAQVLEKQFLG